MPLIFKARLIVGLALALTCLQCQTGANGDITPKKPDPPPNAPVPKYGYQIVNMWPHDSNAFTQGLILSDGKLLESTGQEGFSSLLNGKIYQLTWQHQLGFIYDAQSFERVGQFKYTGEGWGLTTDGKSLILSDGTNRIRFLDPADFHVTKTIEVVDNKSPVPELNELEYVQGEIYANIWHDNRLETINPESGRVTAWIDLNGMMPEGELSDPEAVLNGIAYDQTNNKLYVTGKLWPRIFEIKVRK